MASGVAHDIKNPLTVILLANQMIQRELDRAKESDGAPRTDKLMNNSADVQKASRSIQKLADHLRSFSRGMVEKFEVVDLFDTLSDALFMTAALWYLLRQEHTANYAIDVAVTLGDDDPSTLNPRAVIESALY